MGATYTRQSTFTDGDIITAAHSNDEFNQLLAAFAANTGHTHNGDAGEGGPITKLLGNTLTFGTGADTDVAITFDGNTSDGVLTWKEDEDYFEFSDDILIASSEKLQFRDTAIHISSSTDGQLDLVADGAVLVDTAGDITLDADGGDVVLKDGGTQFASLTNTSGNLIIKSGSTTAMTFDGANVTFAGTVTIGSAGISEAELEILDGATVTTDELNILDGVTATTAELNILDGVTATASELNLVDGITAGTVSASKAVIVDSNKDISGFRNLSITGDLTVSGDDITMGTNTAGNLLVADGTNFNSIAVGDLSEISTVANDDVFLAVDTSGGGLKKITRSAIVSGLATSGAISNVSEDTTPQLGGDLDVNGQDIVSVSNGNITLTPNGTGVVRIDGSNGIDMQSGSISIKNSGSQSYVDFYCESSNAHYARLQAPAHSAFSGNITLTLPATTDTITGIAATQTLTNKTLTSPKINEDVAVTATATEINILDGVTSTTAELNILDGVTSTAAELNILDGVTSTTAELNILDGVTSTAAELNILDGVTSTTAELNILDGVTSTTAELNILDGVTSTATELNVMDGDTSASSITLADADRIVTNDDGTMKQVALTTLKTYLTSAGFTTDDPTALAIALG